MIKRPALLPLLAAAATGIQVGAAMVATRFVVEQTTPGALAMLRYLVGFLCLLPFLPRAGSVRFARADIAPIALLGITQFGILIVLLNFGVRFVPAGRAALIFATLPLLTMLFAASLGRESVTVTKTVSVLLTIAGVAVALNDGAWSGASVAEEWVGALAILASAGCGAVCSVFYRPYLRKYPTVPVSAFAMLASVGFLATIAAGEGFFTTVPHITTGGWGAIIFIGVSSAVGYVMWLWALRHVSPTRVTVFLALSPLTAMLLGAALLDEALSPTLFVGLTLVAAGLWLLHRRPEHADDGIRH